LSWRKFPPLVWRISVEAQESVNFRPGGEILIPGSFDYLVARSVDEAVALLDRHGGEAKILAGGQSLIPLMRFRIAGPSVLVDINHINSLEYIREADSVLHIGALTREAELDSSTLIRERYPILLETSSMVADPVVRNWATVGGNIAHADPANDHPATMLALGARVVARGPDGERVILIDDFFTDAPFETALASNEMLIEIRIPAPVERSGGAYFKLERKVGDYAIVGAAAYITLDGSGNVNYAGIGLTNVGQVPIRARAAERLLHGKPLDDAAIHNAADEAAAASQPTSDSRGPAGYKRAMVRTLTVRALRKALARATGGE
ncbi:MAG TPA: xanthine dehydrogenase family protein subunit M, partial [Ktedonobacteraceae bacterium]|nr:xanthine dehydrogenase family protein subunit M [Ktedonobacteraceae bacterium]